MPIVAEKPAYTPLDADDYRHQARLLLALHSARPVLYRGQHRFVQVMTPTLSGGRVQTDIYLTGEPAPIDSREIELME